MEMTRFDVRNYLEKIYNVHPVYVNVRIALGKTYIPRGCKFVVKDDDVKIAYVALVSIKEKKLNFEQKDDKNIVNTSNTHFVWFQPKTETFTFPDIIPKDKEDVNEKISKNLEENFREFSEKNKTPGFPSWFSHSWIY